VIALRQEPVRLRPGMIVVMPDVQWVDKSGQM
jgi:hypothetical protein